ncbi:MFS multidrug transporter [Mycena leptocephala]|nr:MFS multidrug transporter [Mycena leptocephala]
MVPPLYLDSPFPTSPSPRKGSAFWLSYAACALHLCIRARHRNQCISPVVTADTRPRLRFPLRYLQSSKASLEARPRLGRKRVHSRLCGLIPFTGNLANIFGRRPIMLDLCKAWRRRNVGLSSIIVADLVLFRNVARTRVSNDDVACAAGIGPIIGGALSEKASWRYLFYINIPASAFAFLVVLIFLQVRTPAGDVWSKLGSVDWFGNALIIAGTVLSNIGLTWAGVRYAWSDARVLTPLIAGFTLMVAFVIYEKYVPRVPTMPWDVVTNRTALASLIATFFNGITSISIIYFLPLFFQGVFLASPLQSAIYSIPSSILISPFSFLNGLVVLRLKRYLPGNYVGWVLLIIGFGGVSILGAESSLAVRVVSQIIVASGTGIVLSSVAFPLMAPIPVELLGSALAFQAFLGTMSQTWGITISAAILQNTVKRKFPARFLKELPPSSEFAFAALSRIAKLPEPLQTEVKVAFGQGISTIYRVMIGVAGLGFLCVLFMREVPMRGNVDTKFALKERGKRPDVEQVEKQKEDEGEVEHVEMA